ncbi:hypothetical protein SAMN05443246_1923 [Paenibacillus sp. GP183]|nr:hypothetical protein SAMN05443246_1923 [Paenibacillus sp. GP183]
MQPSIYSIERLVEFQQVESEREARELWMWRTKVKCRSSLLMMLIKLIV